MQQAIKLMTLAGVIVTLSGCPAAQITASSWPGTWPPPTSMNCPRNNQVPFSGAGGIGFLNDIIGPHLTNLHASAACVPQPACTGQRAPQQKLLSPPVWAGQSNQVFTIAQQDTIIINARNAAIAQTPAGKQLYRLTFEAAIITGGTSAGAILATAHYGQCISRVRGDKNPTDPQ